MQAAAAAADDYDHGVWWVPLASLADPALVEEAAAQALGSKDSLPAAIGDKRLLLVLDNFEHLLDAALPVAQAIASCPRLTVLVTSREPLHIDGEWEVAVDPLREREAVDLFVQRATAVRSDFAANGAVAEICRRLDCLPLAVELAAARVKALSPESLLERLEQRLPLLAGGSRSAPERQRTLRATIAWSHDLLSPEEQELFAGLAVFAGGCTLEAAEEVCGADVEAITSLVDKSLLRSTRDRFWMLETIREFAAERLDELPAAASVRDRHAAWYMALGERAGPRLRTGDGREWLDQLELEHANMRTALDHLVSSGRADGALRLAASIWHYWAIRGHWTEGRRVFETLLAQDADGEPEDVVEALWGIAIFANWQGEVGVSDACAVRMLELARQHGLQRGEAIGTHVLAFLPHVRGELDQARALYEESLVLARAGDDVWFLSVATNNLGAFHSEQGEYELAAELFEESLAIGEVLGDRERRGRELNNLGSMRSRLGDTDGARELIRRGLVAATEIGVVQIQRQSLLGLALCEAEAGNPVVAARLLGQSDALRLQARLGGRRPKRARANARRDPRRPRGRRSCGRARRGRGDAARG